MEILKDNVDDFLETLAVRGNFDKGEYAITVKKIVLDVLENKDEALFKYTNKFDNESINKSNVLISKDELKEAYDRVDKELIKTYEKSKKRIVEFHEKQKQNTWMDIKENGEILGQRVSPIEKVGLYIPGGKATYPSSLLMCAIPAKVAGVKEIIAVTPYGKNGIKDEILACAYIAGIDKIYKIGGAQAIAALAYGTETIPKVDKIVGPGNIYVALAKKEVFGVVNIDSIAGPSEILVIADESANPRYIAADLLGQAEHDELASAVLLTNSMSLAKSVNKYVDEFASQLSRKEILSKSLNNYSKIIVRNTLEECTELANKIAPEHLELAVSNPFEILNKISNAGAIFLGHYSPEAVGDYMAGPNHVLPTCKTSRFFSPLGVDDFVKKSSIISFSKEAFLDIKDDVVRFAKSEGLDAHALSASVRGEDK